MSNVSSLKFYYQNVRGLRTKISSFFQASSVPDYDIICLTETWLNNKIGDYELFNNHFQIFRRDRDSHTSHKSDGGGCLIAVNTFLQVTERPEWQTNVLEEVWISITLPDHLRKIHICCVYIPDYTDFCRLKVFTDNVTKIINNNLQDSVIIVGDFNLASVVWSRDVNSNHVAPSLPNDIKSSLFLDSFLLNNLKQYNHIKNINNRILDLILCNVDRIVVNTCELPLLKEDSHHKAIEFSYSLEYQLSHNKSNYLKRDYSNADYNLINIELNRKNWDEILSHGDVNICTEAFYNIIDTIIEVNVPLKSKSQHKFPIWYKKSTIKVYREKNKYHKKWKTYSQMSDYTIYSTLRRRLRNAVHKDYLDWISHTENNLKSNPKKFWSFVSNKKQESAVPPNMHLVDDVASNNNDICNLFNKFFASNFETNTDTDSSLSNYCNSGTINLKFISKYEILNLLKATDVSKGAGPDGISPVFIENCAESLCKPLHILFNKSLKLGVFPDKWKQALITPVFKNGSKQNIENYRPISKLNIFAKIFENIITKFISASISSLIIPQQHGFISNKSTITNLLPYTEFLHSVVGSSGQVDVIGTDFRKAFDKVNHKILISKLISIGIHGNLLRWIESYINNRCQAVAINNCISDFVPITSGVPQGSHLGPILFIIFLNDIIAWLKHSKFLLYADDFKILKQIKCLQDCIDLNNDLQNFFVYCQENKLHLNLNKCHYISFTRKFNPIVFNYTIDIFPLKKVNVFKDLGVYFDSKLKFDIHIEETVSSCLKTMGFIFRTCHDFKRPDCLVNLFKSLILSKVEYASIIWSPYYNTHIERVESVQRKFTKYLDYKFYKENPLSYADRLTRYNLTDLFKRRVIISMNILYKIINNLIDCPDLLHSINFNVPVQTTRNLATFYCSNSISNIGMNSPISRMMRTFNQFAQNCDIFFVTFQEYKSLIRNYI